MDGKECVGVGIDCICNAKLPHVFFSNKSIKIHGYIYACMHARYYYLRSCLIDGV
jgi:hypothetical protein